MAISPPCNYPPQFGIMVVAMKFKQKQIEDLIEIHRRETGEVLTEKEAREMGQRLVNVFSILLKDGRRHDS